MKAYQIKIVINHSHPPIWRRAIIPANLSFAQLGVVLDIVMGWCGYHLSAFEFYHLGIMFEDMPEDGFWGEYDIYDSKDYMIESYLDEQEWFTYVYDFGDDWRHRVTVEKILPDYEYTYPVVVKYKGDTPFEDCGGIYGYYETLDILKSPSHPRYEELTQWVEDSLTGVYDMDQVNEQLSQLRLDEKKSRPMSREEIYRDVFAGKPLKKIQGKKKLSDREEKPVEETFFEEIHSYTSQLQDIKKQYQELQEHLEDKIEALYGKKFDEWTLKEDVLMNRTKEELKEIARLHSLGGYSRYNKERLAEMISREILAPDVMGRYFMFLEDEELALLKKGPVKAGGYAVEWPADPYYLIAGGYACMFFGGKCFVPAEVWRTFQSICTAEWKKEREEQRIKLDFANGLVMLNGCVKIEELQRIYKNSTGKELEDLELCRMYLRVPREKCCFSFNGENVVLDGMDDREILLLKEQQYGKQMYVPTYEELKSLSRRGYLPFDTHMKKLQSFLINNRCFLREDAEELCKAVQDIVRTGGDCREVMEFLNEWVYFTDDETDDLVNIVQEVWTHTRMMFYRGYKPIEVTKDTDKKPEAKKKIYPNDPCPCGSGKKYKKCCGRK